MISVVLCSHNPRENYIARTLAALRSQTLDTGVWELIIVDNASSKPLAAALDVSWHPRGRVIDEKTLGLTPARLAGIRESAGGVIVFVDDDNVLASDYLASVQRIATDHEFLGAWSGSVAAEFEESPPEWTKRYWGNLVIREVTRDAWSNLYDLDATTPLGAGLCVRRTVAQYYLNLHATGSRAVVLDRTGTNMVSGGDNDLAACALDMGYATGVIASLKLTHLIPRERLTEDYLLRLMEGVAYSSRMLKSFRPETAQFEKARGFSSRAADLARRVRMTSREKRFQDALMRGEMRARAELRRS